MKNLRRYIPLTQGKHAIVDAADAGWLSQRKWYAQKNGNHWYAMAFDPALGKKTHMGRRIMGLHNPHDKRRVRHLNGDSLDYRRENLRVVA